MPRPLHAVHEYYITFFLKDKFCEYRDDAGKVLGRFSNVVTTIFTESKAAIIGKETMPCSMFRLNAMVFLHYLAFPKEY